MNRQEYEKKSSLPILSQPPGASLGVDCGKNPTPGITYSLMYGVCPEFEPTSFWMQVRRPATNVTNFFFHFRICIPRTSHIKVFFSIYCHAVLNFDWRAALLPVSFCSPTPPSVSTGSFQPSPNEWEFHYVKHGASTTYSYNSLAVSADTILRATLLLSLSE
jgi:hypothetical protein